MFRFGSNRVDELCTSILSDLSRFVFFFLFDFEYWKFVKFFSEKLNKIKTYMYIRYIHRQWADCFLGCNWACSFCPSYICQIFIYSYNWNVQTFVRVHRPRIQIKKRFFKRLVEIQLSHLFFFKLVFFFSSAQYIAHCKFVSLVSN